MRFFFFQSKKSLRTNCETVMSSAAAAFSISNFSSSFKRIATRASLGGRMQLHQQSPDSIEIQSGFVLYQRLVLDIAGRLVKISVFGKRFLNRGLPIASAHIVPNREFGRSELVRPIGLRFYHRLKGYGKTSGVSDVTPIGGVRQFALSSLNERRQCCYCLFGSLDVGFKYFGYFFVRHDRIVRHLFVQIKSNSQNNWRFA